MNHRNVLIFVSLCLGGLIFSSPAQAQLKAGAGKVEITPDVKTEKIPLGGYAARRGAPATGLHDPVYARTLILANGAAKIGIVSLDLCFLPANVKADVVKRVGEAGIKGLDAAHLLIAATHSHTAPDPLAMHSGNTFKLNGWTTFDRRLLDFTVTRIVESILEADRRLVPAKAGFGKADAGGLNRNRRGEKTTDPDLTLLKVTDTDGKPLAALVNFAAHPTLYDDKMMEISADWPGVLTKEMEAAMGAESVCLFLNGAEGDASPNGVDDQSGDAKITAFGHKVGQVALEVFPGIAMQTDLVVSGWIAQVTLPPRKPNGQFLAAAATMGASFAEAKQLVNGMMPETSVIGFIRLGDLLLVGMPCEPTAEIGLKVKELIRKAGYKTPAVVALSNDWLAYCLTPEQYRDKKPSGNYEAMMSFYGEPFGPTLLTAVEKGLKKP